MAMADSSTRRVLMGSAGRRVYLYDWFARAFDRLGMTGEIHVTDADPRSAVYGHAEHRHRVPPYASADHESAMVSLVEELRPVLFFSVNDYEIENLASSGLGRRIEDLGTTVLGVPSDRHGLVHDKFRMAEALAEIGIGTPATVLLADSSGLDELARSAPRIIIKDRYGSGSSGLVSVESADLPLAVAWATRAGGGHAERLIAQPAIEGSEFGLDVVTPLLSGVHPTTVLARRKIRMRAGETDQAVSADASPFLRLGQALAGWLEHRGSIDVDVIVTPDGAPSVIDINPRFGGGYPFNHLAGADLPALFLAQLRGDGGTDLARYLRYEVGVASSKHEAIMGVAE